jgi:hypothetical protein
MALCSTHQEGKTRLSFARSVFGADRRQACRARPIGPLSLMMGCLSFGREGDLSRAARCWPAKRTLDRSLSLPHNPNRGKGGRGFQGACPLAKHEAAPHARLQARRSTAQFQFSQTCQPDLALERHNGFT